MDSIINYFIHTGDALSQLINVMFLFSSNPNESISGRCYKNRFKTGWRQLRWCIDKLFLPFENNHCELAYFADLERAHKLIYNHRKVLT